MSLHDNYLIYARVYLCKAEKEMGLERAFKFIGNILFLRKVLRFYQAGGCETGVYHIISIFYSRKLFHK